MFHMLLHSSRQTSMRTIHTRGLMLSTVCLFALCVFVGGTVRAQQSCSVTFAPKIPATGQIFSVEQERMLGDIESEWVESNYHADHDGEFEDHLNAIVGRVL